MDVAGESEIEAEGLEERSYMYYIGRSRVSMAVLDVGL